MWTKRFADLRFVIGLFFIVISVILAIAGTTVTPSPLSDDSVGNLNWIMSGVTGIFGVTMVWLGRG